jgi:HSP20 family protein
MNIATKQENDSAVPERQDQRPVEYVYVKPLADVESTKEGYTIRAEMPGVEKSGLEITVENGVLTILGHRQGEEDSGQPVYRERGRNDFRRVFELDPAIDAARITAGIEQGVLTLTLPKAEIVKPRKITVN